MIIIQYEEYRRVQEAKLVPGVNDLATTNPELAEEWDYEKNGELTPQGASAGSGKKVWWICPLGHSYDAAIGKRAHDGRGCPYCSNNKLLPGFNDLETWCKQNSREDLLKEWDYDMNDLGPSQISKSNSKKVWWKCNKGHRFQQSPNARAKILNGTGCPMCSTDKQVNSRTLNDIAKGNDLETWCKQNNREDLLKEWDYENNELLPNQVLRGSNKKFRWVCKNGHPFEQTVGNRTVSEQDCPYCAGKKILVGFNDLETWCKQNDREDLLDEWDYEKNGDIVPQNVTKGSGKKVWWTCKDCGNLWEATIANRVGLNRGCPFCGNKKISNKLHLKSIADGNDLETWCKQNNREDLLSEWDYEKNELSPDDIARGSDKKVWWLCHNGHSFEQSIYNRTKDHGCPYCAGVALLRGSNDLETWCKQNGREELLNMWDYEKNELSPKDVSRCSDNKVFWRCSKGHSYEQSVGNKTLGMQGCPICAQLRTASVPEKLIYFYLNTIIGEQYKIVPNDREALGNKTELDIYIPSLKVAIEYDGVRFHDKDAAKKEVYKNKLCKSKGIDLIRVRENGLSDMSDCYCIIRDNNRSLNDMDECISAVFEYIINLSNIDMPYDIYSTGGEDDFINCKRDMQQAIDLRDSM